MSERHRSDSTRTRSLPRPWAFTIRVGEPGEKAIDLADARLFGTPQVEQ